VQLAEFDFCGRDIRNAVKQACISVVVRGEDLVCQKDLIEACQRIRDELDALARASEKRPSVRPVAGAEQKEIAQKIRDKLSSGPQSM